MDEKIDVVAHIESALGEEEQVRAVLETFVEPTRAEKGCLRYDLFRDVENPAKFTFIEEWASMADLRNHSQSEHILNGRARLKDKLAGPSWVQVIRRTK